MSVDLMEAPHCISNPAAHRTPGPTDPDHVLKAAECISKHLASDEVEPGTHLKPHPRFNERGALRRDLEKTVKVGQKFSLTVTTADKRAGRDDFAILKGFSKNGSIVICASGPQLGGSGSMTGKLEFIPVGVGKTEVVIYGAHRDTLTPGSVVCKVSVVE